MKIVDNKTYYVIRSQKDNQTSYYCEINGWDSVTTNGLMAKRIKDITRAEDILHEVAYDLEEDGPWEIVHFNFIIQEIQDED